MGADMEGVQRDHVVPFANLQLVAERVRSTHLETMVVAESYHVLTVDRDREQIVQRIQAFI
jgi:carboxylesterase